MNTVKRVSLCSEVHEQVQATILNLLGIYGAAGCELLDVGCWNGRTTVAYGQRVGAKNLYGVEGFAEMAESARGLGLSVATVNIESEAFPFADCSMDIVVCNQVLEHLKDIFTPMDEMVRVLKPGGVLILSVPNLASFHSRIMLLLGIQPSPIRVYGPHVRGFVFGEMRNFLVSDESLQLITAAPVGFYPFSAGGWVARNLGRMWKNACHTPVFVLRKVGSGKVGFKRRYSVRSEQTLM